MSWPYTNDEPYDEVVRANDLKFDFDKFKDAKPIGDLVVKTRLKLIEQMPRDLQAYVAAGGLLKYEWKQTDTGYEITATSAQPFGVRWDGDQPTVYIGREKE